MDRFALPCLPAVGYRMLAGTGMRREVEEVSE